MRSFLEQPKAEAEAEEYISLLKYLPAFYTDLEEIIQDTLLRSRQLKRKASNSDFLLSSQAHREIKVS